VSRRALPAVALLFALAATLTLAAPALAAPPPEPVCSNCEPAYERAIDDAGLDASVVESGAVVTVGTDGDARWRVGLVLSGPDAAELARNDSLHRQTATEAVDDGLVAASPGPGLKRINSGGPRFPDAEHVRYYRFRDPDFARDPIAGGVVVTEFRPDLQGENYAGLGVDQLSVHSHSGITHTLPGVDTISGLEGSGFSVTEPRTGLVTYGPLGTLGQNPVNLLATLLGLTQVLLPVVLANAAVVVLPALAVHAAVTGGLFALLAGSFPEPGRRERHAVAGLLGATATVLALQPLLAEPLGAPILGAAEPLLVGPAAAFAVVAVGLVRPSVVGDGSPKRLAARALVIGAAVGVVAGTIAPGTTGWTFATWALDPTPPGATAWDGLGFALMVAGPTLALLPAGAALAEGRTRGALTTALAGAALGWVASPVLYFAQTGLVVPGFFLGFPAVSAALLFGAPLLLAGWVLAEEPMPAPAES
jgi:hypothetical protein